MQVRQVVADAQVENLQDQLALEYGPFVYCAEMIDNPIDFDSIKLANTDTYQVKRLPQMLGDINCIELKGNGNSFTFIPYYSWANRGVDKMKVWFPQAN